MGIGILSLIVAGACGVVAAIGSLCPARPEVTRKTDYIKIYAAAMPREL